MKRLKKHFLYQGRIFGVMWSQEAEVVVDRCSSKRLYLKITQVSQENTFVGVFLNKVAGQKDRCFRNF